MLFRSRDGNGPLRTIHRQVGTSGSFGAAPLEQHIGLGASARITAIDVTWPGSGLKQHFADVPVNQAFSLEEGAATLTPTVRPTLTLGGVR